MSKENEEKVNSIEMEMSVTKFLWEENFDLKLLEFFGIIVDTSKKSVYCTYCNCFLSELSCSKNSNIYNIKLHVICNSHKLHYLIYSNRLHSQSILSAVNHTNVEVTMPSNDIKISKSQLNVLINLDCKKLSGENTEWLSSATRKLINNNFKGILDDTSDFQLKHTLLTTTNNQIYCNLCNCELAENSELEHLQGRRHSNLLKCLLDDKNRLHKFFDVPQLHQLSIDDIKQILETFKENDLLNRRLINCAYKNQLGTGNVDKVFQVIEENLKKIDYIKQSDFNIFEIHRNLILFTNNMIRGYCKTCEKYFSSTKNCIHYYNLMEHICTKKHLNKFKKSLPIDGIKVECEILVWFRKQVKNNRSLDDKKTLSKFFDTPQMNSDSNLSKNDVKQALETFKENNILRRFLNNSAYKNQLDKENVEVFQLMEEYLKKIDYIKQSDFNIFEIHRNLILFTNNMVKGYCRMCEKYFSTKNSINFYNLIIHICGKKHCNKLKKSLSDYESKAEYKILVWLKKQIKSNEKYLYAFD